MSHHEPSPMWVVDLVSVELIEAARAMVKLGVASRILLSVRSLHSTMTTVVAMLCIISES
jgi:hypothetical protein